MNGYKCLPFFWLFLVSVMARTVPDETVNYSGWRVIEVGVSGDGNPLGQYLNDNTDILNLNEDRIEGKLHLAIPPNRIDDIMTTLEGKGLTSSTMHEDLSRIVEPPSALLRADLLKNGDVTFDGFMTFEQIERYLKKVAADNPTLVTHEVLDKTFEGRDIHMLTITGPGDSNNRPVVVIDAGAHAREWISPAAALNLIKNLIRRRSMTNNIVWKIVPILNADGYVYSWKTNRLWRKNRADNAGPCRGVDLNRNYDYHWMESGSSDSTCSDIFAGYNAFSEPETKAMRDLALKNKGKLKAYVSIHAYGQFILHPWGYSSLVDHPNNAELDRVGQGMAMAMKNVSGNHYKVGPASRVLYSASGGSDDWMAGKGGVPLSYTFELQDTGTRGFLLPEHKIKSAVKEAWKAFDLLAKEVIALNRRDLDKSQKKKQKYFEGNLRLVEHTILTKMYPSLIETKKINNPILLSSELSHASLTAGSDVNHHTTFIANIKKAK